LGPFDGCGHEYVRASLELTFHICALCESAAPCSRTLLLQLALELRLVGSNEGANLACPFRKSYPDVLMMQSGQDWNGDNDTGPMDCSMQGRIFL
jgi:hypothetical protein